MSGGARDFYRRQKLVLKLSGGGLEKSPQGTRRASSNHAVLFLERECLYNGQLDAKEVRFKLSRRWKVSCRIVGVGCEAGSANNGVRERFDDDESKVSGLEFFEPDLRFIPR